MAYTSAGLPAIGNSFGSRQAGTRERGVGNGARYTAISSSLILRITEPGSTRSTKTLPLRTARP
jgi:hypothetical protein